ncbi:hypothetical protein PHSC3_000080 [Chlamydiales bacterium STE3]|nr:hypothetical protein PHSC3_000080 [Chlamydiales bacterium STE3]
MFIRSFLFFLLFCSLHADELVIKNNLRLAKAGDYIVASQGATMTVLRIFEKQSNLITLEEVTLPASRVNRCVQNWRGWYESGAPGNTSWVIYQLDLDSGTMIRYFSYTKNGWFEIPKIENFLGTLLNLPLYRIPDEQKRKIGPLGTNSFKDRRCHWQPQMVVDGHVVSDVAFDAYRTRWPKDGSPLAGKSIEIYVPEANTLYPAYFPYWMQISGIVGKARLRIIDSGAQLNTPKKGFPTY